MCKVLITLLLLTLGFAQSQAEEWEPIGTWPFEYKNFQVATVYSGVFKIMKTQTPCNIHLGNQALWFVQNDTLKEAQRTSIICVEFNNGDVFIPIANGMCMGKVVREDTLAGNVARIYQVRLVDQNKVDERAVAIMNMTQNLQQSDFSLGLWGAQLSDINSVPDPDELPIPLNNVFFFQYNGEIFEATEKQILAHIRPDRKREYRNFTREAEIISQNLSSMLRIWESFFVRYDQPQKVRK